MKKLSLKKLIIIILAIILLIASYFVFFQKPETAAADWWDDSWLYRQTVGITNTGTAETDFQVMITLDSATLITANKVQSDCDDIRITDINGKLIPHWIEPTTCNTSTTKIWTKVPSISTSGDTVYLYYGNSAVDSKSSTADTFIREILGVQGAWDMDGSGAIATDDTLADASGNTNTGTASNVNTTGMAYASSQFGQGVDFDGVDDYVDCGNDTLSLTNDVTVSAWVKIDSETGHNGIVGRGYPLYLVVSRTSNLIRFWVEGTAWSDFVVSYEGYAMPINEWHYVVVTYNDTTGKIYVDGVEKASNNILGKSASSTNPLRLGGYNHNTHLSDGSIDAIRVYNTALSQSEISDLYGTGGDRHGYVTTNYPNKSLVRKYSASVSVGSPASEERGPGPVAYWKFDEGFGQTANDSTINANNGTLGGTSEVQDSDPTWQTEDMCVSGKCLKFDGVDDYVDGGNGDSLNITDEITIEAWVKPNTQTGNYKTIVGKTKTLNSELYEIRTSSYTLDTTNIQFRVGNGTEASIATTVNNGVYTFVSGVYDGSTIKIYKNGVIVSSNAYTSGIAAMPDINLQIGKLVGHGNHFNGFIDSVKIYPYARTAAQIKADYAARGTGSGSSVVISDEGKTSLSQGLVGYWKMDEASWNGTAGEVVDSSGSENDGVAVGATGVPTTGAGKFGNGGVFDGTDDYVSFGTVDMVGGSSAMSVGMWVNIGSLDNQYLFAKYQYGTPYRMMKTTVNRLGFDLNTSDLSDPLYTPSDAFLPYYNVWTYLTFIYDGTKKYIYINGAEIASSNHTGTISSTAHETRIGYWAAGYNAPDGSIDSVRIYNRALSPGEVRDLYNFAPGPVGWWKMDEKVSGTAQTINDSSGYGNTGTTSSANGTGMDCMVPGKYGSACEFDGVDDYVDVGNDASLNITDAITIEAWVKGNDFSGYHRIVEKNNAFLFRPTGDSFNAYLYIDGAWRNFSSNIPINTGEWLYFTFTYDFSTQTGKRFVNGVLKKEDTLSGLATYKINSYASNVLINSNGQTFNGSIDDVRIYNYARTPSQIIEDYSAGAGRKQPIGHWKFDEGYGTTANNSGIGGSSLNGTLTNMSSPATATSGWTDSGKIGKGLVFDGGDDYVDCGYNSSLDFKGADKSFTTEAWININSLVVDGGIVGRFYFSGSDQYILKFESDTNDIKFAIRDDSGYQIAESAANTISTNVWTHIVGVADSGTLQVYINGVTSGTIATYATIVDIGTEESLEIGVDNRGGGVQWFNGSIDDVKIYNYALTEDEVRKEYNQGALLKLGSTGTDSSGNADDSASREYCIPGDTSTCNPPVGRWDFNEGAGSTVNDISGNNNTGTWSGTGSHWTTGKIGKGGVFNGSDDYVDCGNGSSLEMGTNDMTYTVWVKLSVTQDSYVSIIIKGATTPTEEGYVLSYYLTDDDLRFWISNGTTRIYPSSNNNLNLNDNSWHFVAVSVNRDGNVVFYKDGVSVGTFSISSYDGEDITNNAIDLKIGEWGTHYFNGTIDQVRIYDYARTPAQIAWDYNRGKPVAHWKFDECQGGTAYDASGNGNDGTININGSGDQTALGTCTSGTSSIYAWGNGVDGKYNSGMSFDGEDDYVEVADDASLNITDAITIEAWVKPDNLVGLHRFIFRNQNYQIRTDSQLLKFVYLGVDTNWHGYQTSNNVFTINNWHHIVVSFTYGSASSMKMYINGNLESGSWYAGDGNSLPNTISTLLYIGKSNVDFFNGSIDEVKIYNYALTAEQVKMEYSGGAVRFE